MKKIKEFAVLCGTSSKTLRFYDRIGLLEAEYTDPENGYRYYSDGQKNQYEVISMFKEIGFTLDEIKTGILGAEEEEVLEILKKKAAELDRARTLCRAQIGEYEKRIRRKSAPGNGEVAVQRIPEEGKIILTDGTETRVFLCQGEALDAVGGQIHGHHVVPLIGHAAVAQAQAGKAHGVVGEVAVHDLGNGDHGLCTSSAGHDEVNFNV